MSIASVKNVLESVVISYSMGAKLGSSSAIATLYRCGPLGQVNRLARSFTTESKPVERIAANHSESTFPRSIGCGAVDVMRSS